MTQTTDDRYSFFLFASLAWVYQEAEFPKEIEYDTQFEKLDKYYQGFRVSTYNDSNKSEYECMEEYLKNLVIPKVSRWNYTISTNTIWTSFDYGYVEAQDYETAKILAQAEIKNNFSKANDALKHCDITDGFKIEYDESQIELTEVALNQMIIK